MMKHSGKIKSSVALDIGSHSVKMIEISGAAGNPSLVSFGIRKVDGSSGDAQAEAIRGLSEELKIDLKETGISLSGPSVVVRVISMPDMTDEDLKNAVRFETEKSIPFDINECMFDFYIQGKDAREKNNLNILLAAAKKDSVLAKVKAAEDAGFRVNVVDVDGFAVTNAFLKNYPAIEPAKTIALLNIGATCTNLVISSGGLILFVRDLAIGVNAISAAIYKKCGTLPDLSDGMNKIPAEKITEMEACAKSALVSLLDEIKLSFGYHENQSGRGVDEIYISGGGAGFIGMEAAFREMFGMKPERWDPLKFLMAGSSVDPGETAKSSGSFAICAGLALRGGAW
ncbi:MAG: type IV pilus assembly protein PilM [Candidatus Omnitrophota bacterium]